MIPTRREKFRSELPIGYFLNQYYDICHDHEHYEFMCIVKGRGLNIINDRMQFLESKFLMLIRPSDVHYIRKIEDFENDFEGFNVPVPREFMENEFALSKQLKDFALTPCIPKRVKLRTSEVNALFSKIQALREMPLSETKNYIYYKLIQEMCSYLLLNQVIFDEDSQKWFPQLLLKLESIKIEDLTYKNILSMSNVSTTALWKMFKKHLNISPSDYIKTRRAEAAYDMLINTDKSFLDIAMELGYGGYVQFYRDMKNRFGAIPKIIRDQKCERYTLKQYH